MQALAAFAELRATGEPPSTVTYTALIGACNKVSSPIQLEI